jgi:2-hydroxychromene-2-carboxylate isomerase
MTEPTQLDFYFDVRCPYAWRTSLWVREVCQQRPVVVTWKQFSLSIVNNADPESDMARRDLMLGRLFIGAERLGGNGAVDRLYLALGDAMHGDKLDPMADQVLGGALTKAGLPADLRDAVLADDTTLHDYRASHEEALRLGAFGVPSLVFDGADAAYFGPVVEPIPTGASAVELWDFTLWSAQQPYLWEWKRDRKGRKLGPQPATVVLGATSEASDADACAWVPGSR